MPGWSLPAAGSSVGAMAVLPWAALVGYWDLRYRRIPNGLTFGAMSVGIVDWALAGASPLGAGGAFMAIGAGLALLLTLPGYFLRQLGAGDVKLLLAIALLGGTAAVLISFVLGALGAAAVVGVRLLVGPGLGLAPVAGRWLPFGACLAMGFIVAVLTGQTGALPW
jgi:prepilin peptidase CpaA